MNNSNGQATTIATTIRANDTTFYMQTPASLAILLEDSKGWNCHRTGAEGR